MRKRMMWAMTACATAVLLVSCAPQTNDGAQAPSDNREEAAVAVVWSPNSECGVCHAEEQATYDNSACAVSQHQDQECVSCHDDEAALSKAHEGATGSEKMPTKLKKTEVSDGVCLSCHFETREALAAQTADITVVDSKGTAVNPHDVPQSKQHDTIQCADCHGMHDAKPLIDKANAECASCHHTDVFECYTCHD